MSLVIIWSVMEVTFRLGFDRPAEAGWLIFSYCVDGLFLLDMLVSLRTAIVTKDGIVVANQKQVAIAYLKASGRFPCRQVVAWASSPPPVGLSAACCVLLCRRVELSGRNICD